MSVSRDDYDRAAAAVVRDLEPLGEDLVAAYLYGSAARGDMRAGTSDLDVAVFLRRGAWTDREAYLRVLGVLEEATRNLARSGVPFDGLLCYLEDELHYVPWPWRPDFRSARDSRLLAGVDVTSGFDEQIPLSHILREQMYIVLSPAAVYLARESLTPEECLEVLGLLQYVRKFIPQIACCAAGRPAVKRESPGVLGCLFPDLDLSVLADLEELRNADGRAPGSGELKRLLKRCLVLIEDLHRKITARSRAQG